MRAPHGRPAHRPAPRHRAAGAAALGAALVLAAASACTSSDRVPEAAGTTAVEADGAAATLPAAVQSLDVVGTEYAFAIDGDDALVPGWTRVAFHNEGAEAHQVMFASLKEGVDLAELAAAAGDDSSGAAAIEYVDMLGGVSYVGPGQSVEALVEVPEGVVMAMCYVPDPDGVAHALSGMTSVLTVGPPDSTGPSSAAPAGGSATEPVQGTITMGPDGYQVPDALPTGWYRVVNADAGEGGQGLHELSILGLEEPLAPDGLPPLLEALATNATPDVPLVALGGMGALSAGFEGFLFVDLPPGPYLAVDFMPDPGEPRPHLLDGYATAFEA